LPLPGALPDMKAQSSVYVKLQSIYKAKARRDVEEVLQTVRTMPGGEKVDPGEVEMFCKNARFVKLINVTASDGDLSKVFCEQLGPFDAGFWLLIYFKVRKRPRTKRLSRCWR
jgi:NEDD8-activating enzyme E1 regulatory subunit